MSCRSTSASGTDGFKRFCPSSLGQKAEGSEAEEKRREEKRREEKRREEKRREEKRREEKRREEKRRGGGGWGRATMEDQSSASSSSKYLR